LAARENPSQTRIKPVVRRAKILFMIFSCALLFRALITIPS